jgi:hypothetical protein
MDRALGVQDKRIELQPTLNLRDLPYHSALQLQGIGNPFHSHTRFPFISK